MKITILGATGSVPVEGSDHLEFGGATSCVLVETEDQAIYLDAGSGIVRTPDVGDRNISILLSHPHLDHILGMPFFPYISKKNRKIDFFARKNGGLNARQQLDPLFSAPLWPITVDDFAADFACNDVTGPFDIGNVHVTFIDSVHPGGGTVFKLSLEGRSIVYATDYEYDENRIGELIGLANGCDLLFFDAQYTDDEFEARKGFGHSTVSHGMRVMEKSGAQIIRFVHHDPRHSDEFLRKMESEVKSDNVSFARRNEVIIL